MPPIYTFDIETDPFQHGRQLRAFACGFYDGSEFVYTWGSRCLEDMRRHIEKREPGLIYAHNGGRFDFYFILDWLANGKAMFFQERRMTRVYMQAKNGQHELRDSVAIFPFALKQGGGKLEIDYSKMELQNREKHKREILRYLKADCVSLHEMVIKFQSMFGNRLTIGQTSMKELQKLHKFSRMGEGQDYEIRTQFYYGGRVECFEKGQLFPHHGAFYCFDINQSYPFSMRSFHHPTSSNFRVDSVLSSDVYFLVVEGYSTGHLPVRTKIGLTFPRGRGVFSISIHEFNAAIETGALLDYRILKAYHFDESTCFDDFVDEFHGRRKQAKLDGDEIGSLFNKYVGNSAYGKFAQSAANRWDYMLTPGHNPKFCDSMRAQGWEVDSIVDFANRLLWRKKPDKVTYYNVATGASITGASRSHLIRALAKCERPIYCDTDSIICEGLDVEIDNTKLGAWKLEANGDRIAVAGKKMYALFQGSECVKQASKGVHLTAKQIWDVAGGAEIEWLKESPTYSTKKRGENYLHRRVRMT